MSGCATRIHQGISAPLPGGRNSGPPKKQAKKYQLAAVTPCSPNTSKSQRSMQDCAAQHQCFSRFSGVSWLLGSCPVHSCSMPWWGSWLWTHTQGPRGAAHQRHWCTLCLGSIPGHRAAPLCSTVEDLNDHHLNYLFGVFHAPFQDALWKLLINGQIFFP